MKQGHPGPLGSMCLLVMAWVINCQPLSRLTGLALSWACLPTQLIAPDSMNAASRTSCNSFLLLMITAQWTEWPGLGLSLPPLSGQICHLVTCPPQAASTRHEEVVVSLPHLWWRSPVFPNNTESQASQMLVSLLETGMVNMMGCSQMPLDLQGHSSHLVVWGCGPQSGY